MEMTKGMNYEILPKVFKGDTVMFLVNYDKGWELLSADKRAPMVVMQADEGHMTLDELFTNPAEVLFDTWMSEKIHYLRNHDKEVAVDTCESSWNSRFNADIGEQWILVSRDTLVVEQEIYGHLTQTRWGQGFPWHEKMPYIAYDYYAAHSEYTSTNNIHCAAGCSPVACAQLLYYLHFKIGVPEKAYGNCDDTYIYYPGTHGVVTSSMLNLDASTYSSDIWNQMSVSSTVASDSTKYVSVLLAQMGMLMETDYSPSSGSTDLDAKSTMLSNEFGLTFSEYPSFNYDIVRNQIVNYNLPVLINVYYINGSGVRSNDHAAIIDASKYNSYLINSTYVVVTPFNGSTPGSYEYRVIQSPLIERFVGFNWGYHGDDMFSGSSVKWYNADAISWVGGGNNFNRVYKIWYGFH